MEDSECHHQRVDGKGSVIEYHHRMVDGEVTVIVKGLMERTSLWSDIIKGLAENDYHHQIFNRK